MTRRQLINASGPLLLVVLVACADRVVPTSGVPTSGVPTAAEGRLDGGPVFLDAARGVACQSNADCPLTDACLWLLVDRQVLGRYCLLPCSHEAECGGDGCTATGLTCLGCREVTRVCAL